MAEYIFAILPPVTCFLLVSRLEDKKRKMNKQQK
ncbi:hypothetical protein Pan241w_12980 [Gimesia alba]|uniref:Uncharacterized protein n=1 Tax=Gimesia alba TaxID=2527973 RepID=A0A517RBH5_9PLAN|nr:hypothetical protein Pan241w_12980 [Gimesia alba]